MEGNPNGKFEWLVHNLSQEGRYEKALEDGLKIYQIKQYHVAQLSPDKIIEMYNLIATKFYHNQFADDNQPWHQNQLRVFIWLVVCYAFAQHRHISQLGDPDWRFFSQIFNNRNPDIFEFQSKSILKKGTKSVKWDRQEVEILDSLIKSKSIKNKWNEIAKELFIISGKRYFRTAKQCREHWINHLNTNIKKSSWTSQEDLDLVETILKQGKKWSRVSKMLGGKRTQHMVKNRFKSLFHFESKQFDTENIQDPQVEKQILQGLIWKLKANVNKGNKHLQKLQQGTDMLKEDDLEEGKEEPYNYSPHGQQSHDLCPPIIQTPQLFTLQDHQSEEIQRNIHKNMSQLLEEDCVGIFFQELQH